MEKIVRAVAYPTIPIIFLGGIKPDRTPLYNTMGLAVTSLDEKTRTETTIELSKRKGRVKIDFFLNKEKIGGLRGKQIIQSIKSFVRKSNFSGSLTIHSTNHKIFSGSSDSGLAALYTALNSILDLNFPKNELLQFAMKGSESAGRSLYGGLTLTKVDTSPISVIQIASETDLRSIKLFSVPFTYDNRLTADEIHKGIVTNPAFAERVNHIPIWIDKINTALAKKNFLSVLAIAEENILNAHKLLEDVGIFVRKPEMMRLCQTIESMRNNNVYGYCLIGGGNLVTIATTDKYADAVAQFLSENNWSFYNCKIAGPPKTL